MSEPNARFISRAYVANQKAELKSHWCVLQHDMPGTCQITISKATQAKRHDIVALDLGWGNMIDRVFMGYVDRVSQAENGYITLFCRELTAVLAHNYNIVLRHPTMKQVIDALSKETGLEFVLPSAGYVETAIPCFYADTSGFAILDNIGRAFKIKDFIWQQQGNGKVYVGSYQDSFWNGKKLDIPNQLMTKHKSAKQAQLAAVPKMRPNVTSNGQRIKSIEFKDTNMILSW